MTPEAKISTFWRFLYRTDVLTFNCLKNAQNCLKRPWEKIKDFAFGIVIVNHWRKDVCMCDHNEAECLSACACTERVDPVAYWEALFDEVFGPVLITIRKMEDDNEQL